MNLSSRFSTEAQIRPHSLYLFSIFIQYLHLSHCCTLMSQNLGTDSWKTVCQFNNFRWGIFKKKVNQRKKKNLDSASARSFWDPLIGQNPSLMSWSSFSTLGFPASATCPLTFQPLQQRPDPVKPLVFRPHCLFRMSTSPAAMPRPTPNILTKLYKQQQQQQKKIK